MSLFSYIDHLRQKPLHVRRQIQVISTISLTALVGVVWLYSFGTELTRNLATADTKKNDTLVSPFEMIKNDFVAGVHQIQAGVIVIKDTVSKK